MVEVDLRPGERGQLSEPQPGEREQVEGELFVAREYVWPEPVTALFDGQEVALTAAFAPTPITLLGREDFFAGYRITIGERDQMLELAGHRAA